MKKEMGKSIKGLSKAFRSTGATPLKKRRSEGPKEEEEEESNLERPSNRAGFRSTTPSKKDLNDPRGTGGLGGFNPLKPRLINQMMGEENEGSLEDELIENAYGKTATLGHEEEEEEGLEGKTSILDNSMTSMLPPTGLGKKTKKAKKKKKKLKKEPSK